MPEHGRSVQFPRAAEGCQDSSRAPRTTSAAQWQVRRPRLSAPATRSRSATAAQSAGRPPPSPCEPRSPWCVAPRLPAAGSRRSRTQSIEPAPPTPTARAPAAAHRQPPAPVIPLPSSRTSGRDLPPRESAPRFRQYPPAPVPTRRRASIALTLHHSWMRSAGSNRNGR